jgi:hypothetical protein
MIATVNGKLYGKPGVGIYDLSLEKIQDCCCGLKVESVEFGLLDPEYDPFCLRQATGTPEGGCRAYNLTLEGAVLLAADYLEESRYIATGDTLPGRPCGFCEGSVYLFFLVGAVETETGFIITFEAEDCSNAGATGIPPRDYLCTVTISKCG